MLSVSWLSLSASSLKRSSYTRVHSFRHSLSTPKTKEGRVDSEKKNTEIEKQEGRLTWLEHLRLSHLIDPGLMRTLALLTT